MKQAKRNRSDIHAAERSASGASSAWRQPPDWRWVLSGAMMMVVAFLWSYWPTLGRMVREWIRQPDYSHGFLVLPIAAFFLWQRRASFPREAMRPALWGAALLVLVAAVRYVAGLYYLEPLDGWTIPLWVAGAAWMLLGTRCLLWSLPSIVFLYFMFPIPYSWERGLSLPLQAIATKLSTVSLLILGQPALQEGNTIWLGEQQLFVEEACSGLRILVGIAALAFGFALLSRWKWWQKALVVCAIAPVAILANVVRIVITGLLYQLVSGEAAMKFTHDLSGLFMIPLAAAMLWLFGVYVQRLFPEIETVAPMRADAMS